MKAALTIKLGKEHMDMNGSNLGTKTNRGKEGEEHREDMGGKVHLGK